MTIRLSPYVTFDGGTARAAMDFYRAVLGGELTINTFGEFGVPDVDPDAVMHAQLESPAGLLLMASDRSPQMSTTFGNSVTVMLFGGDEAELRRCWDGLAEGATITVPLEAQMWGDTYGQLTDRFGLTWQVNIEASQP